MMETLIDKIFEMIDVLKDTSSLKSKKEIFGNYISNQRLIVDIVELIYDSKQQYGITPVFFKGDESDLDVDVISLGYHQLTTIEPRYELRWLKNCLKLLKENRGNRARAIMYHIFKYEDPKFFNMMNVILSRNLNCGINLKTINSVLKEHSLLPIEEYCVMLGEQFELSKFLSLKWNNIFVQEKMDGIRVECFYNPNSKHIDFLTRNGKLLNFDKMNYLLPLLENVYKQNSSYFKSGVVLCIELCGEQRQKVSGIVQTILSGKTISKVVEDSIVFNVFDCVSLNDFNDVDVVCKADFIDRYKMLEDAFDSTFEGNGTIVKIVKAEKIQIKNSHLIIQNMFESVLKSGGEGLMIKNGLGKYVRKRSWDWIKLKEFKTMDLMCDGINMGTGKYSNMVGSLSLTNADGSIKVNVGTGITDSVRQELTNLGKNLIGKIVEVKYNSTIQNKENNKLSLFLPVFVQVRTDKENSD